MALVANDQVALPRASRATQWDEPTRCPRTGNPVFWIKNLAPNPEGYAFWRKTQVPRGLRRDCNYHDWPEDEPIAAIVIDLTVANVQERAAQLDAWARKKLRKVIAANTSTRWRDQAYGLVRFLEFCIQGRCRLNDANDPARVLLAGAAGLPVGNYGHSCVSWDYSTLRRKHTRGAVVRHACCLLLWRQLLRNIYCNGKSCAAA
eukprot:g9711.t1